MASIAFHRAPGRGRARHLMLALSLALAAPQALAPVLAQGVDCGRLQAQIASLPQSDGGRGARFGEAAARQQGEIGRTLAYASSIGCDRRQFLIFGSAPPPQCAAINGQVARMRANLSQLLAQGAPGGQRRDLVARYDAQCRGTQAASNRSLFDGQPPLRQVPLEDAPAADLDPAAPRAARGGSHAICVRKCDGGFFPVNYSTGRANLEQLGELCQALCPNAEAALYTSSGSLESALSAEGEPYTELPTAFKYRKAYDPACTCKPPNQSWVQALAEAEKLLARTGSPDIVVTAETSDDLARGKPVVAPAVKSDAKGTSDAKAKPKGRAPKFDPAAAAAAIAADALDASDGPSPENEAPGIATAGPPTPNVVQGALPEVTGRDGVKRKVRSIAPPVL